MPLDLRLLSPNAENKSRAAKENWSFLRGGLQSHWAETLLGSNGVNESHLVSLEPCCLCEVPMACSCDFHRRQLCVGPRDEDAGEVTQVQLSPAP
jgi:hypothetical protein